MANKKLKDRKKKAAENRAKTKVLARRVAMRSKAKHDKEVAEIDRKYGKKLQPYMRPDRIKAKQAEREAEIKAQLEHNLKILKALEDQYLKDKKSREERNAALESEGHTTLREKMDAMNEKAQEK